MDKNFEHYMDKAEGLSERLHELYLVNADEDEIEKCEKELDEVRNKLVELTSVK